MHIRGILRNLSLSVTVTMVLAQAFAQTPGIPVTPEQATNANYNDPDRKQAMQLFEQHKMSEALPLLEKVLAKYPKDVVAQERLGVALVSRARTQSDPEKIRADRLRARAELLKAKALGDNSDLCNVLLAGIPEDGGEAPFSQNKEVEAAMQRGEAAFADGKFSEAIKEYTHAFELNPTLYLAAVDLGDSYFRLKQMDRAGEWFAKAIEIDANQEVAYRYWGDALMAEGKVKEARQKFIEGLIANPYLPTSWTGLNGWLRQTRLSYRKINIQLPKPPEARPNGSVNITVDPSHLGKNDGGEAWLIYSMERALWQKEKFSKECPDEKAYRHSLKEEVSALSMALSVFEENRKKGLVKEPDPSLTLLEQIKTDTLLESYVLLVRPDQGIAQDYASYRIANRDKLIQFLDKYIVPTAP